MTDAQVRICNGTFRVSGCPERNFRASMSRQVDKMSGGITNVLLKLAAPQGAGPGPVALRVFGENTEVLIDRHEELGVLLQLNAAGFGAPVRQQNESGMSAVPLPA